MKRWSPRERGLGVALVMVALAAIAVPAWAESTTEEAGSAAAELSFEKATGPAGGDEGDELVLPAPSGKELEELERFERCMRERGITLPAPPPLDEEPSTEPLPAPGGEFERAAAACGLPGPGHEIAFAEPGEGEVHRLCPLPPPPEARG